MKKTLLTFLLFAAIITSAYSQNKAIRPDQNSVVKDSSGMVYPYAVWQKLFASGQYRIKIQGHGNETPEFFLEKLSDADIDARNAKMPRPRKSDNFNDGEKVSLFTSIDIDGKKIKQKDLAGKVVVLNFWFIGCPPCRQELPELNDLSVKYHDDPNVVFIAVALDNESDLQAFLKINKLGYHVVSDGKEYADLYKIHLYPTNVVIDKEGKVVFSSVGYSPTTPYWIKKGIEESKQKTL